MPTFLMRLLWRCRGKRRVLVHLIGNKPSVEGILLGRWSGHYVLLAASVVTGTDESHAVEGHVEIPTENVLFVQVLARGVR